jgi:hypothetical protein
VAIALAVESLAAIVALIAAASSAAFPARIYYMYVALLTALVYYDIAAGQDP